MAIVATTMVTFITAFGEKVAWMSMDVTGGAPRAAFMLGTGKKAADMAWAQCFLGLDMKKRPAFFKHPDGKKTLKWKKSLPSKLSKNCQTTKLYSTKLDE